VIFKYFRYRVRTSSENQKKSYISGALFGFLKKCVPITEMVENPVSVSENLLKMHRLLCNVHFATSWCDAPTAQLIEHHTSNLEVVSLNLGQGDIFYFYLTGRIH
jgi:hypothetical protein